jgi:hypothetical protein
MLRAARVDRNQAEIVKALRAVGCSVQTLHRVGQGCPDLLVGVRHRNVLMEVKNGQKVPSARKLTDDQIAWRMNWKGQFVVVESVDEALAIVKGIA